MVGCGVCSSMIVVMILEVFRDVINGFIRISQKLFFGCRHIYEIVGSSILDILPDFLYLEGHCFGLIGHIRSDKWNFHIDIV